VEYLAVGPERSAVVDRLRTMTDCTKIFLWLNILDLRRRRISKAWPGVLILSRDES
jgi:hypothetical protein